MANIAISALPVAASQAGADVLPIVQATTSTTKQLSVTNLFTSPTFVTPALGTVASGVISADQHTVIEAGNILIMNHISAGTAGSYLLNAQSAAGTALALTCETSRRVRYLKPL
jgi:hypothetical protein